MTSSHVNLRHKFRHSPITLPCHSSKVHSIRWSPDGSRIASGGKDWTMRLHKISESSIQQDSTFKGHGDEIDQLCWNPTNQNLIATASIDSSVRVWDVRSYDPIAVIRSKNENMSIAWSPDGSTIAVSDKADVVTFLDSKNSFKVIKEHYIKSQVVEVTWNRDNDLFYLSCGNGKILVLNYPTLDEVMMIDAFSTACICIDFDLSGKFFAVGSNDAIASIWDSENLACCQSITRSDWPVRAVSFSHDSRFLASGSEDSFIDIADVFTGEQVMVINVSAPTSTLDFHPKEHILAFALEDGHRDEGSIKIVGLRQCQ